MPGGDDWIDDLDESIIESLIILGLAGALAFLVYYRQQRQNDYRRRQQEDQPVGQLPGQQQPHLPGQPQVPEQPQLPGQQPDNGFFPQPEDPNYGQWVAGH